MLDLLAHNGTLDGGIVPVFTIGALALLLLISHLITRKPKAPRPPMSKELAAYVDQLDRERWQERKHDILPLETWNDNTPLAGKRVRKGDWPFFPEITVEQRSVESWSKELRALEDLELTTSDPRLQRMKNIIAMLHDNHVIYRNGPAWWREEEEE